MEYIDGDNLKNRLHSNGAKDDINLISNSSSYLNSPALEKYYLRVKTEKPYLKNVLGDEHINEIYFQYNLMLNNRFIYEDIKYGNLILNKDNIYWVDFEHCKYHFFAPPFLFSEISNQYLSKLDRHFTFKHANASTYSFENSTL